MKETWIRIASEFSVSSEIALSIFKWLRMYAKMSKRLKWKWSSEY
jgi:hypothetical protein